MPIKSSSTSSVLITGQKLAINLDSETDFLLALKTCRDWGTGGAGDHLLREGPGDKDGNGEWWLEVRRWSGQLNDTRSFLSHRNTGENSLEPSLPNLTGQLGVIHPRRDMVMKTENLNCKSLRLRLWTYLICFSCKALAMICWSGLKSKMDRVRFSQEMRSDHQIYSRCSDGFNFNLHKAYMGPDTNSQGWEQLNRKVS